MAGSAAATVRGIWSGTLALPNRPNTMSLCLRLKRGPIASRMIAMLPLALAGFAADSHSLPVRAPSTPAAREFPIMAWGDAPADRQQLLWMREAGFNISGFCRPEDLQAIAAAGLTCFVDDPRANGYRWQSLPDDPEIRKNLGSLAREIGNSPAALGIFLRDEPLVAHMAGLGRIAALVREIMPGKLPYVNLFPWTLSPRVLGSDYESYARMLVDTVKQPYLSYDNYSLVDGEMLDYFYTNLDIIRRVGLATNTPFWNCILAVGHGSYMTPTEETLRLQVYATLAYGGRGIEYFRYFTRGIGNYRGGAVDPFGDRTPTWDMVRRINHEVAALAPTLLQLRSTGVYHYPDVPDAAAPLSGSRLVAEVRTGVAVAGEGYKQTREMLHRILGRETPGRFLLGEFEDGHQRPYLMLVNKSLTASFRFEIRLKKANARLFQISPFTGKEEAMEGEMDWLAPGAGILLRVE